MLIPLRREENCLREADVTATALELGVFSSPVNPELGCGACCIDQLLVPQCLFICWSTDLMSLKIFLYVLSVLNFYV